MDNWEDRLYDLIVSFCSIEKITPNQFLAFSMSFIALNLRPNLDEEEIRDFLRDFYAILVKMNKEKNRRGRYGQSY